MTLPYPPAIERGPIKPLEQSLEGHPSIPIAAYSHALVRSRDGIVEVAGRCLTTGSREEAIHVAHRFELAIAERMLARRPHATDETWGRLTSQLRGELVGGDPANEATLATILATIDGL
jgi:hypothetical protein